MTYKIKNRLIPIPESHRQPILAALSMYDRGEDLTNSPLIQSKVNLTHADVYFAEDKEKALQDRQKALIALYEKIKSEGYNDSPILCWFDDQGFIHLYDGYHRLSILEHLKMDQPVLVETSWRGIDDSVGRDFPIADVLSKLPPGARMTYQPVSHPQLDGWACERKDSPLRLEHIVHNLTGQTVLDIGCSEGYFSRELAKHGYKVTAIDTNSNLIAAARYLSILEGVKVDYHIGDWKEFLGKNGSFDNILFLSVIHNEMKIIGVEAGLEKLKALREKAGRVFFEVPNNDNERQWMRDGFPKFDFHKADEVLQERMAMSIKEKWSGLRSIFLMEQENHKVATEIPGLLLEPDVDGHPMYLFEDEKWITPIMLETHKYEPKTSDCIKKWLKPGQTFVDAGAHIGYFAILASKIVGGSGKVYAFEPSPKNFEVLKANIELNKCSNVIAINKALLDKTGQSHLYKIDPTSHGQLYLQEALVGNKPLGLQGHKPKDVLARNDYEEVETVRLDEVLSVPPDMVKLDVEGSEMLAIKGMGKLLDKPGNMTILVEDLTGDSVKHLSDKFGFTAVEKPERWNHMLSRTQPWWNLESWLIPLRTHYKPLFDTLMSQPCRNIMEIGTHAGNTAVVMIKSAAKKVPEEEIHYYGFDLFEEMTPQISGQELSFSRLPPKMKEAEAHIKKHTKAKVTLIKGNTRKTLEEAVKTFPKMDLIFIDGGHTIETTRNDWEYASKLMHKDTIVYFDDYCDEMPFIGAKFIIGELGPKYATQVMPDVNYYPEAFGRLKSQLLKVQLRQAKELEQDKKLPWWHLESWLAPEGRRTHCKPIFDTVTTKPCRNIMEIGVNRGLTAFVAIKAATRQVPEQEIHYYGLDLFEDMTPQVLKQSDGSDKLPLPMHEVKSWLEKHLNAKITLIKGDSRKILKEAIKTLPKMDLIHIDGGHTIETVRNDWEYCLRLMHKDTVVYIDGYNDEMPFIGCMFLLNELGPKYSAQVMPQVDYYPKAFGRGKNQLLKIQLKKPSIAKKTPDRVSHYRFHLLGLPHSKTTKDWILCPFTQLTYKMAQMMTDLGHEVIHYGTEGSNPPCAEQVDVLTEAVQKQAYGDWTPEKQLWIHRGSDLAYTTFRENAIREIKLRMQPQDLLLISIGGWQKEVADALPGMPAIEFCVGYQGIFSKFKVFASYAWMHYLYGLQAKSVKWNLSNGNWYDAVIPHYFDPKDFEFSDKKDDYYLFVGRIISRKGPHIAVQLTERLGAKLVMAGQPIYPSGPRKEASLKSFGMDKPHVEYVGTVNREERNKLMSKARAVIIPSLYMEPFGKVIVESMLCGTPVITTDWGSFAEINQHGVTGYRCRTMDDFIWAANNVDKIDPHRCREYAVANYSMDRISKMYQEYFSKIMDLFGDGWYAQHPERKQLDWLRRY